MDLQRLNASSCCAKPVENLVRSEVLSDAAKLQLLSKRQVCRWFEAQTVDHLKSLDHWLYGFLVRLSHPRPYCKAQAQEFARLVAQFKAERPEIKKEHVSEAT